MNALYSQWAILLTFFIPLYFLIQTDSLVSCYIASWIVSTPLIKVILLHCCKNPLW